MRMVTVSAALLLAISLSTATAAAQSLDFTLVNLSTGDVVEFYVSHSDTKQWEENLLEGVYLPAGNEIDVSIDDNRKTCNYDVRAVFDDGTDLEDYRINFCDTKQYVIEDAQPASSAPQPPAHHSQSYGDYSFETPSAVFEAAQSALQQGDMTAFIRCLTPSSVSDYAVNLAGVMAMTVAFAGMMEGEQDPDMVRIKSVLDRHGLTAEFYDSMNNSTENPEAVRQIVADSIVDKHGFITDIHAVMAASSDAPATGGPLANFGPDLKLGSYAIRGNQATGTVTIDGEEQTINFKRVDGNWLLEL